MKSDLQGRTHNVLVEENGGNTHGGSARLIRPARSVGLVGTYPPTVCGLATFSGNLRLAITKHARDWNVGVVPVVERWQLPAHEEVLGQWVVGNRASLGQSLETLNALDVVLLQHEFGIFGGRDGIEVVVFVDELQSPLIAVLHTVLVDPTLHQRDIFNHLLDRAVVSVVLSHAAHERLVRTYPVDPERIVVVPHGAAENTTGPRLSQMPKPCVLTWGLLGPGKGIEHGIAATARLSSCSPVPTYVIAGQTHPKVHDLQGECYRDRLKAQARSLDIADRVIFDESYRDWESLRALVRSADVVLLPYDSREQVTSGVLVEAVASGKPVVATRFPHAEELLAGGAGILVSHGDVDAMAVALDRVLNTSGVADRMSAIARRTARPLLWPAVGARYCALIEKVVRERERVRV